MTHRLRSWIVLAFLVAYGCGGDPESGPGPVVWDRDVCEHCQMAVSDRAFATQVRTDDGRLHHFDDPGCALLWMHEHHGGTAREIWVRNLDGSSWLDARRARFVKAPLSPMGYGYGARPSPPDQGIELEELMTRILTMEEERRNRVR